MRSGYDEGIQYEESNKQERRNRPFSLEITKFFPLFSIDLMADERATARSSAETQEQVEPDVSLLIAQSIRCERMNTNNSLDVFSNTGGRVLEFR